MSPLLCDEWMEHPSDPWGGCYCKLVAGHDGPHSAHYPPAPAPAPCDGARGQDDLLLAARLLVLLVREEFPASYSLSELASIWRPMGATDEQLQALERVEDALEETSSLDSQKP